MGPKSRWWFAVCGLALLCGCPQPTTLSYDEIVDDFRFENGPFSSCGSSQTVCPDGPWADSVCIGEAIASCRAAEHELYDPDTGELATTFVVPTGQSCEVIVFRDLPQHYDSPSLADYRQESCAAVEVLDFPPCVDHLECRTLQRWNRR